MEDPTKLDSSGNENKTEIKGNTTGGSLKGAFSATVTALVIMIGTVAYAAYNSIGGAKTFGGKSWLGD